MKEKILSRGNIALFLIAAVATLATALVCNICGADRITIVASGYIGGTLTVLGIGALYRMVCLIPPMGSEAGILGIITSLIVTLIVF